MINNNHYNIFFEYKIKSITLTCHTRKLSYRIVFGTTGYLGVQSESVFVRIQRHLSLQKTTSCYLESVMSSMYVWTPLFWDLCILRSVKTPGGRSRLCSSTYSDFTTFQSRPTLVPSVISDVQKSFMTWISSSFTTLSWSMWPHICTLLWWFPFILCSVLLVFRSCIPLVPCPLFPWVGLYLHSLGRFHIVSLVCLLGNIRRQLK
jgi:hypothetical protein